MAARTRASNRVWVKLFTVFCFAAARSNERRGGIDKHTGRHEFASYKEIVFEFFPVSQIDFRQAAYAADA